MESWIAVLLQFPSVIDKRLFMEGRLFYVSEHSAMSEPSFKVLLKFPDLLRC